MGGIDIPKMESAARLLLSLLIEEGTPRPPSPAERSLLGSPGMVALLSKNMALVRSQAFLGTGGPASEALNAAAEAERGRIKKALALIGTIGEFLSRRGIDHVFPKAFQHYPDMGHDVDLLVSGPPGSAERLISGQFPTQPGPDTLVQRIAGKRCLWMQEAGIPLEIHHGRVGHLGEHDILAARLIGNRRLLDRDGVKVFVPRAEDQFLLQAVQRICGHMLIRVSDAASSLRLLRGAFDWGGLLSDARDSGAFHALRSYASYLAQIHPPFSKDPGLPSEIREAIAARVGGAVWFDGTHYRFPVPSVPIEAYSRKFIHDSMAGRWGSALRVLTLPMAAASVLLRKLSPPAASGN